MKSHEIIGEGYGKPWMKIASRVGLLPKDNETTEPKKFKVEIIGSDGGKTIKTVEADNEQQALGRALRWAEKDGWPDPIVKAIR